jgi:cytochrome c-type protein NapC/trimethylamine-N-oxide reductase cytochrome c-type subunit TorC
MVKIVKRSFVWIIKPVKRWGLPFILGVVFAIGCFMSLNASMKPFSTNMYCGANCHEMDTAYRSWELSTHGANAIGVQVDCVECHLPPKEKYFSHLFAKAWAGTRDMYMHHFGPEYDSEKIQDKVLGKMSNQTCAYCHEDLLMKPSSSKARFAHQAAQLEPDKPENKCITCHEQAGHKRNATLFSP